jgi:hypothetical protein
MATPSSPIQEVYSKRHMFPLHFNNRVRSTLNAKFTEQIDRQKWIRRIAILKPQFKSLGLFLSNHVKNILYS